MSGCFRLESDFNGLVKGMTFLGNQRSFMQELCLDRISVTTDSGAAKKTTSRMGTKRLNK